MQATFKKLSAEEAARYKTEGYILYHRQVFDKPELHRLRTLFEEKIANLKPDERPEQMDVPGPRRRRSIRTDARPRSAAFGRGERVHIRGPPEPRQGILGVLQRGPEQEPLHDGDPQGAVRRIEGGAADPNEIRSE